MLSVNELASYINVKDIPEDWITYYEEAMSSFNEKWLSNEEFNNIINFYNFDDTFKLEFRKLFLLVIDDVNLNFLVYLWFYILYKVDMKKRSKWKYDLSYFKDNGSLYMPILAMLMGYKVHNDNMKDYDSEQVELQKAIIRDVCTFDKEVYNISGMRFSNMEWGSRFIRGSIVKLGILQYELKREFLDGKDAIFVHIPRNIEMTKGNVDDSFRKKDKVFNYFKVPKDILFVCESWLLSPELKDILKKESNILYFQSKFNIIEILENKNDFIKFVFNEPFGVDNYDELRVDTSLQKVIKEKLIRKEKLHIGLGILK